mmetsp:Transcript_5638/g.16119  ORF Transcript_5638/g.16119 Transcript_5638/m.16119 type:complete len:199 (+) Transcript_5638:167-763(+)|eukprot:CAMPEP_0206134946 /NCGR_PEP_ID=MMETSP1473-20131121/327_1 /ASSEMBLY_ACC=CAM_ASM_001109 /TAXON_ID=1461547 /ORGANISM="Stichococcus sp, Strain RCC1054" /LENGTH=198 /DNA_ID=CAMNT_0053526595 /DNA_START=155 /DNA_END=751 /DNA_ORIENTATION=-
MIQQRPAQCAFGKAQIHLQPSRLPFSTPRGQRCMGVTCSATSSPMRQPSTLYSIKDSLQLRVNHRTQPLHAVGLPSGQSSTLPIISTEEEFQNTVDGNDLLIVDFMARWCRKCIYLKPKLEKMLRDDFPGLPILFVDVNAVPSAIIKTAGIKKMPTIQLYHKGKRVTEHIAAEGAIDALEKIKLMILRNTDLKLKPRQ